MRTLLESSANPLLRLPTASSFSGTRWKVYLETPHRVGYGLRDHPDRLRDHPGRVQGWESVCWGVLGIPLFENKLHFFKFHVCFLFISLVHACSFIFICMSLYLFVYFIFISNMWYTSFQKMSNILDPIFTKLIFYKMFPYFLIFFEVFL